MAKGWYCDRFGQRTRTQVITYSLGQPPYNEASKKANNRGATFGWSLSPSAEATTIVTIIDDATASAEIAVSGSPEILRRQFSN